jgi:hypothetical protein
LYVASRNGVLFLHVREGEPDSGFPVPDSDFKMNAEVLFGGCEELEVELNLLKMYISASEVGVLDF